MIPRYLEADAIDTGAHLLLGLAPVLVFLLALIVLDSYKLVRLRAVAGLLLAGGLCAGASYLVNLGLGRWLVLEPLSLARYVAPVIEELLKGLVIAALIFNRRIGFLVDAAICGFAVGAGFATVENVHYLTVLANPGLLVWLIRGFGTAIMHGGVTAILAIMAKSLSDRRGDAVAAVFLPGLLLAIALHSAFNHFFLAPDLTTLVILLVLPLFFVMIFRASEERTREWLGSGFDTDAELLRQINAGKVSESRIGGYLEVLKLKFDGRTVADILCLLRLRLELSIRAKGILLMRRAGFALAPDPELDERFAELRYLEKTIGATGLRALAPIFHMSNRDLWQYHMLARG